MFGLFTDFNIVMICSSEVGFKLAWKRARHIRYGHPFHNSIQVDKMQSENHPQTDDKYIYTINLRKCNECGLIFQDVGFESRR